ncbi:unnamed protein product, partial [Ectocarpus fasciculatus]
LGLSLSRFYLRSTYLFCTLDWFACDRGNSFRYLEAYTKGRYDRNQRYSMRLRQCSSSQLRLGAGRSGMAKKLPRNTTSTSTVENGLRECAVEEHRCLPLPMGQVKCVYQCL